MASNFFNLYTHDFARVAIAARRVDRLQALAAEMR